MAKKIPFFFFFFILSALLQFFSLTRSQSFIGVNYGQVADNLPPPEATKNLLVSTSISKIRLFGADPGIIRALANTNISIVVGASNGDIPSLASSPTFAAQWVAANVLPFVPSSKISTVSVGNEVLESNDPSLSSQLLPAMQNLHNALSFAPFPSSNTIKVSTVNTMAILSSSEPPSSGAFHLDLLPALQGILGFLQRTGSPFMINPYPYFAYRGDPSPETLAFCLFQPNPGRFDPNTRIYYMNMWDAQLDAIKSALVRAGFPDLNLVVAETGWPHRGDPNESGATVENAEAFNGKLIQRLRSMVGTPLMPGRSVDTYIFALYDEDTKPGPTSERSFGLFHPDLSASYDVGLFKSSGGVGGIGREGTAASAWCVPKEEATDQQMQADLDYACSQQGVDCGPIQPGGACFEPNTVRSHAAYAMNQLYHAFGRNPWNCDFLQSATLTSQNPSYQACNYPAAS